MVDDTKPEQPSQGQGTTRSASKPGATPSEPVKPGPESPPTKPAPGAEKAAAGTPKPAAKKPPAARKPAAKKPAAKKPAVMETAPWEDELTAQLAEQFGDRISEFSTYVGQKFLVARMEAVPRILEFLKLEAGFDYLVDVTAVDYPKREKRFDLIYILYSFARNERIRIKARVKEGERPESVVGIYLTANWLEREVYDMFGIEFANHPNLKRILLPEEWEGFPLRKDAGIRDMDNQWVKENLGIDSGQ